MSSRRRVALLVVPAVLLGGCSGDLDALDPAGPDSARVAGVFWFMFVLGTVVFVVVLAALLVGLLRGRGRGRDRPPPPPGADGDRRGTGAVVVAGIVLPAIVLTVVFGVAVDATRELQAERGTGEHLVVDVIGHQYWWEIRYPQYDVITANELHVPVGEPVEVRLTSADVIHSFWPVRLAGKVDAVPGRTTTLWLEADEPNWYGGQCAEFCGIQHANMRFWVSAVEPAEFDAWVQGQRTDAREPADEVALAGREVFMSSSCVYCHTIAGTPAAARVGPDLTHLASRRTLAAGTVPNSRGHLGGWIVDPQAIKRGNLMPPTGLSGEELQALLTYLEGLE